MNHIIMTFWTGGCFHMNNKNSVEVSLMGQKFEVKSDSNEQYVEQIAAYVNKRIEQVLKGSKSVASLNVALLVAMNITAEFFKYRDEKDRKVSQIEKKVQDMIEIIDAVVE
ncbi:MAG: hypothetical protein COV43_02905 [Deltaproteobacteria bacterium CG11_big_fil_rev_8_21_14_0_20_42_23]|nr:MAG: hypothetical protein COV43_02905 [Deltaproteobacteria bacterium CG11_big_fil_rev_8_21_14_0_20_42_23]PJC63734.1 MAG: hypothetical protein CO021_07520 [Deltaproteobacteria bacterium CG_4_9_14_0_2_um_filter_42_21]